MQSFKKGDIVERINNGLIDIALGSRHVVDYFHMDSQTVIVEGSNQVLYAGNFKIAEEKQ